MNLMWICKHLKNKTLCKKLNKILRFILSKAMRYDMLFKPWMGLENSFPNR